jgi:hypothetical protein
MIDIQHCSCDIKYSLRATASASSNCIQIGEIPFLSEQYIIPEALGTRSQLRTLQPTCAQIELKLLLPVFGTPKG